MKKFNCFKVIKQLNKSTVNGAAARLLCQLWAVYIITTHNIIFEINSCNKYSRTYSKMNINDQIYASYISLVAMYSVYIKESLL